MATLSCATIIDDNTICQGDIFRSVKYSFIEKDNSEEVHILEYEFPHAVIISQACDVVSACELSDKREGKPTKFMPSILLCPIFGEDALKASKHLVDVFDENGLKNTGQNESIINSDDRKVTNKDWHYRFHRLKVISHPEKDQEEVVLDNMIIDFKQYFTLPPEQLLKVTKNRICRLDPLFGEQITLKFCTFLSRVAIP